MQVLIAVTLIILSVITTTYQLYVKEEVRLKEKEKKVFKTTFKNEVERIKNIYRSNYAVLHSVNYARYLSNNTHALRYINLMFTKNRICSRRKEISKGVYGHDISEIKEGDIIDNFKCVTYESIFNSDSDILNEDEKIVYKMIRPTGDKAILFERTTAIHYKGTVIPQLVMSVLLIDKVKGNKYKIVKKVRINSYDIVKEKIKSAESFLDDLSNFFVTRANFLKKTSKNPLVTPFSATYVDKNIYLYLNGESRQAVLPIDSYIFLPNSINYSGNDYLDHHIVSCDDKIFKSTLEEDPSYSISDWENRSATEILYRKCRYRVDSKVDIVKNLQLKGRLIKNILPSSTPLYHLDSSVDTPYSYFFKKRGFQYKFITPEGIQQVFTQKDAAILTLSFNESSSINGMPVVESSIQTMKDWLKNRFNYDITNFINPFTGNSEDLPDIILFDFSSPYLYYKVASFAKDYHSGGTTVFRVVNDYKFSIAIPYPMDHIDKPGVDLPYKGFITGVEKTIDGDRDEEKAILPGWFIKIYSLPIIH